MRIFMGQTARSAYCMTICPCNSGWLVSWEIPLNRLFASKVPAITLMKYPDQMMVIMGYIRITVVSVASNIEQSVILKINPEDKMQENSNVAASWGTDHPPDHDS